MNRRSLLRGASEDQDSPETVNSIYILEDQYSGNTVNNIYITQNTKSLTSPTSVTLRQKP